MMGIDGSSNGARSITQLTTSVWFTVKDKVLSAGPGGGERSSSNGESAEASSRAASDLADPLTYIQSLTRCSAVFSVDVLLVWVLGC